MNSAARSSHRRINRGGGRQLALALLASFAWAIGHAACDPATCPAVGDLAGWLKSTPQRSDSKGGHTGLPYTCPQSTPNNNQGNPLKGPNTPPRPSFGFNFPVSELKSCSQDGPYQWVSGGGGNWYVQRIVRNVCTPAPNGNQCELQRFTRVCSKNGETPLGIPSPCAKTTGPKGCAVCGP